MIKFLSVAQLIVVVVVTSAIAQPIKVTRIPSEFQPLSPQWGNDVLIHNREPVGRPSAAGRSNGTAYIAVPDTAFNRNLTTYKTTNFGQTWSGWTTFGPPQRIVDKVKMLRGANDSIYMFTLEEGVIIYRNIENVFSGGQYPVTGIRDFDVAMSSTGGTYLFYDLAANNSISRAASADYGATWPQVATVTTAGSFPRIFMNNQALDTLVLNYYGPVRADDTLRSVIRQARYREVATGNLAAASFIDVNTDTAVARPQYGSAKIGNVVWFFNTRGGVGSQDIQLRVSTDAGVTFGAASNVAALPSVDESWFDLQNYTISDGGLDFVYQVDSAGTTNDRMMYAFLRRSAPSTLVALERISGNPVVSSTRYQPTVFEYYDSGAEVGVIWVGLNGTQRAVYYDRYNAPATSVQQMGSGLPAAYILKQNYPNPFNPTTAIEFGIPKNEFVQLKVYDLLGREVQTLVSENLSAGTYKVKLNGQNLAAGVYMYRLQAGNFVETRKLTLLK
jgi:hypothetical protein